MVVLRIALSLIVVLCFAAPAAAFDIADLNGDWFIQALETSGSRPSGSQPEPGGWLDGFVRFSDGVVVTGQVIGPHDPGTALDPGSIQVTNDGAVTGTVAGGAAVRGRILPGGKQMVLVVTSEPSTPVTYSIVLLTKFIPDAVFTQGDLTGTWLLHSLLIPDFLDGQPAGPAEWAAGEITFSAAGAITGGTLRGSNGQEVTALSGNFTFVPNLNQVLTGALAIGPPLPAATDISFLIGFMSVDKNTVFGTTSRTMPTGDEFSAFVLQKKSAPPAPFTQGDAAGRWELVSLQARQNPGDIGESLAGTLTVDGSGKITGGALTGPGGEIDDIIVPGGTLTVDAEGVVIADFFTEIRSILASGRMVPDKNLIFGVDDLSVTFNSVGLLALVKPGAEGPPPGPSVVQFQVATQSVGEGATATVIVNRTGATNTVVTVQFDRIGGTANPGTDFTLPQSRVLTFQKGQTSQSFDVATLPDQAVEGNETVVLELSNPTGGATVGARKTNTLTITDGAAVQFSAPAYSVKENVASVAITAIRTGGTTTPFTVTYTAIPGTAVAGRDYTLAPGTLTFAAGVTSRSFSVAIKNNTLADGDRSLALSLGVPTNGVQNGTPSTATLTIQDDDLPGSFKVDKPTYTVAESAGSVSIIVRRLGTSLTGNVTVDYFTVDGTATSEGTRRDYAPRSGTLTFKAGESMKTVDIRVFKNNLVDGPKTFTFRLSEPSSGDQLVEGQSSALITITDVDLPGVIKFVPDKYSVSEGAGEVKLTVQRSGGLGGGVLVDFQTVNGTAIGGTEGDFQISSGTLSFGFGNTSATIIIPIRQDTQAEGNETFTVELVNARIGTRDAPELLPAVGKVATVTIVDDESAFQFIAPALTVKEGTPSAVITVLRTGTLTTPATVTYTATPGTAQPGTDFTPVSGTLTFAANTPSKTFNVPIVNNTRLDGPRSVLLALGNPTGGAQLGTVRTATLTIDDNEQAGTFKLDKDAYTVLESAGFVTVNVLRSGLNLTGNVSVNLVATDGTAKSGINYGAPPTTLIFAAGEITKPVKVPILRDFVVTGPVPQRFTLALSEPSSGATLGAPASATVTVTEADAAGQVKFSSSTYIVSENVGNAMLTVVRTGGTAGGVVVQFTTVDGTATTEGNDYTFTNGSLTFGPGNTSATIMIPITSDEASEGNESFQVRLLSATGGATLGSPATATVTIMDDDSSMVQFSGNFIGNFPEVIRIGNLTNEVLVDFAGIDGTAIGGIDYTPTSGTITFKANTRATTIPLVIVNDPIAEGNETFAYVLRNPRGARLGPDSQKTFIIQDNDFGGSDIQFTAPSYTAAEGQAATLTVTRTGGLGTILVVQWSAGEGTATPGVDFSPVSGTVTFGVNDQRASFTINLLADGFVEGTETVPITLSVPQAAATLGAQTTTMLQIQDVAPPASVVQSRRPRSR